MRRGVVVALVVLLVLGGLLVGADSAAVAVAASTVSDRVEAALPGATGVTTSIDGFPALTQVLRGSLDHVTVTAQDVPTEKGTLDSVVVELSGVSTSSPYTASQVKATALVPLEVLQAQVGSDWVITVEGPALHASFAGALPVEALVAPTVADGGVSLEILSMSLLGVEVSGDAVPDFVTQALNSLVGSVGDLPFGLVPSEVAVTPTGVAVTAEGSDVALG